MIKKDYIMNQIEMLTQMAAKLILRDDAGQDSIVIFNSQEIGLNNDLNKELGELVKKREINSAENMLFFEIEKDLNLINFNTAIAFYDGLTKMDKSVLRECDFQMDEISEGFGEVCELYQIVDIVF
ncbi:MAG: DUF6483 family protein [Firmicutes bacterium]|nr:DUF6483 family protein [Bacillota bacterium]